MKAGLSLVMLLVLGACGNTKNNFTPMTTGESTESMVTTPGGDSAYHRRPLPITQTASVSLTQDKEMKIYYDCFGHITSSGYEGVNALTKTVTVDYPNRKNAWSYAVYNRTTRDGSGKRQEGKFVIDHTVNLLNNMKVVTGTNLIEYVFYKCSAPGTDANGDRVCAVEAEVESEGIMELHVDFNTTLLPGSRDVRPTNKECIASY